MIRSTMRRAAAVLACLAYALSLSAQSAAEALYRVTLNLYPGDDPAIVASQLAGTYRGRIETSSEGEPGTILLHLSGSGVRLLGQDPRVAAVEAIAPNDVGSTWSTGTYGYDGAGNIKSIGPDTFVYDKIGRLRSGTAGTNKSQAYTYDPFGNIETIITDGNVAAQLVLGVEPTTNRISRSYAPYNVYATYTLSGNVDSDIGGATYSYDAVDMVKESTVNGIRKLHLYNADDERIASVTMQGGTPQATDWTIRDASGKVLRRFNKSAQGTWTWVEDYIYRGDTMLAAEVNTPERRRQFHPDHLGTPRLITGGGGAELSRHRYYPFGQEVDPVPASAELKKFTGHERDSINLDYMHARYYKPYWGRFLSVDPGKDWDPARPQSWNLYTYVRNNPMLFTDPTGRNATVLCDEGNNCVVSATVQAVRDPNDQAAVNAANDFKQNAENYWNAQQVAGPNGEQVTFNVTVNIVNAGSANNAQDTMTVVNGTGIARVRMNTALPGQTGNPADHGLLFTTDGSGNPSGHRGVDPHEMGHFFGLGDTGPRPLPNWGNGGASQDIMTYAQPGNSPLTAGATLFSPANRNVMVIPVAMLGWIP
jgi:RHS repeat-associated protein